MSGTGEKAGRHAGMRSQAAGQLVGAVGELEIVIYSVSGSVSPMATRAGSATARSGNRSAVGSRQPAWRRRGRGNAVKSSACAGHEPALPVLSMRADDCVVGQ